MILPASKSFAKPPTRANTAWLLFFLLAGLFLCCSICRADENLWKITAYCSCSRCCGKSDGIMASGKKVYVGACALNWLPFGTKVEIDGLGIYTVEDRGAKSLFGTKQNKIKHIDIYFPSHKEARKFGVKHLSVKILPPQTLKVAL